MPRQVTWLVQCNSPHSALIQCVFYVRKCFYALYVHPKKLCQFQMCSYDYYADGVTHLDHKETPTFMIHVKIV